MILEKSFATIVRRRWSKRIATAGLLATAGLISTPPAAGQVAFYNADKRFNISTGTELPTNIIHIAETAVSATGGGLPKKSNTAPDTVFPGTTSAINSTIFGTSASASANAKATIDNLVINEVLFVPGKVHVDGLVVKTGPQGGANATSDSKVKVSSVTRKGAVKNSFSSETKLLSSKDVKAKVAVFDPMSFDVLDLFTGDLLLHADLFDFTMELDGEGEVDWEETELIVDAQNFTFTYDLTSPFLQNNGLLDFSITGGVVTKSTATGILAGLLPSLGSTGIFHIPLPSELTLEYDLGDFGDRALDISFTDEVGGRAEIVGIPEPGTLAAGLTLVGFCATQIGMRRRRATLHALLPSR